MNKKELKNHLLTAEYGKFDFVDNIVPKDVLLIAPPRVIVQYLVAELDIKKEQISMPALRSWLFNYRKKNVSKKVAFTGKKEESINKRFQFTDTDNTTTEKKFNF